VAPEIKPQLKKPLGDSQQIGGARHRRHKAGGHKTTKKKLAREGEALQMFISTNWTSRNRARESPPKRLGRKLGLAAAKFSARPNFGKVKSEPVA